MWQNVGAFKKKREKAASLSPIYIQLLLKKAYEKNNRIELYVEIDYGQPFNNGVHMLLETATRIHSLSLFVPNRSFSPEIENGNLNLYFIPSSRFRQYLLFWKHVHGAWMRNSSLLTNYPVLNCFECSTCIDIHRIEFPLHIACVVVLWVYSVSGTFKTDQRNNALTNQQKQTDKNVWWKIADWWSLATHSPGFFLLSRVLSVGLMCYRVCFVGNTFTQQNKRYFDTRPPI